jgi:fructokinase
MDPMSGDLSTNSRDISKPFSRVVVFGEVLFDEFPDRRVLGGAPFNVARHLGGFGRAPLFVSRVGTDARGREVLDAAHASGLDTRAIQLDDRHPTGRVRVFFEGASHGFEIVPDQAYDHVDAAAAREALAGGEPSLLYFGTLAQRGEASRAALDAVLERTDGPRTLDVNLRRPWYDAATIERSLEAADTVKLNGDELREIARMFGVEKGGDRDVARRLVERFELRRIVSTFGDAGAWLVDASGDRHETPEREQPVAVVDTVGAGDGFSAVLLLGELLAWDAATTIDRADRFARAICQIRGAIPDDDRFYLPFAREWGL